MNIKEMHYDFKQKLNKIDSQQYRNLKVPEIDWKLNEAINLFIKIVAEPKYATRLGFETSQRTIDDIRTIVKNRVPLSLKTKQGESEIFELPSDYLYYVGTDELKIKGGSCSVVAENVFVRQHDDNFQSSPFDSSSFLWKEVNIRFYEEGIRVFNSGEFLVDSFLLNYIGVPSVVANPESYPGGSYKTLAGVVVDKNVDCNLPVQTHREIVDIAVAITTGDLQIPDYQIKMGKLGMNQIS